MSRSGVRVIWRQMIKWTGVRWKAGQIASRSPSGAVAYRYPVSLNSLSAGERNCGLDSLDLPSKEYFEPLPLFHARLQRSLCITLLHHTNTPAPPQCTHVIKETPPGSVLRRRKGDLESQCRFQIDTWYRDLVWWILQRRVSW